jgi:hypothetical protein
LRSLVETPPGKRISLLSVENGAFEAFHYHNSTSIPGLCPLYIY